MQELSRIDDAAEDALSSFLETIRMNIVTAQKLDFTPPWDLHASDEMACLYIVASGRCHLKIDGEENTLSLGCGDMAVLLNKKSHQLKNDNQKIRRLISNVQPVGIEKETASRATIIRGSFSWEGEGVESLLPEMPPVIHVKFKDGKFLPWMIRTIMIITDDLDSDTPGVRALINHLANVIFLKGLLAHMAAVKRGGGQVFEFINHRQIRTALYLMNAHPEESWSLASLARKCAMSRSAFAEGFRKAVGQPPMTYLLKIRMNKACNLLGQSFLGIKEISERAGYRSQPAFSNAFKRWTGAAPGVYRKSRRNQA
jgi:AraC-like DNA-binding protein